MGKKAFYSFITLILISFIFTSVIRYYRPSSPELKPFESFPMQVGEWSGEKEEIAPEVIALLNPQEIISATYTNPDGQQVHLLFDFFSADGAFGGPHSPRNCLPGSGWTIEEVVEVPLKTESRNIPAGRFQLRYDDSRMVMDFWYITHYGETSNDYVFKLYELLSALTFKSRDVAFVRFVTDNNPKSLSALEDFKQTVLPELYTYLPY